MREEKHDGTRQACECVPGIAGEKRVSLYTGKDTKRKADYHLWRCCHTRYGKYRYIAIQRYNDAHLQSLISYPLALPFNLGTLYAAIPCNPLDYRTLRKLPQMTWAIFTYCGNICLLKRQYLPFFGYATGSSLSFPPARHLARYMLCPEMPIMAL